MQHHRRATSRKQRPATPKASYSRLEQRNLLAGNVTVFDGDNLYLRGDNEDNNIEIVSDFNGSLADGTYEPLIVIRGRDGTTVNGQDQIEVPADGIFVLSTRVDNGIRANFGKGNDTLFVDDLYFDGESIIYGGPGDDSIGAYRGGFRDVIIQTFHGDDAVSLEAVTLNQARIFTLDGDDSVSLNRTGFNYAPTLAEANAFRSLIVTGAGDDTVVHNDMGHRGESLVLTQGGADFVSVTEPNAISTARVFTGDGPDEVYVDLTNFDDRVENDPIFIFAGQAGEDRIEFVANEVGERFTQLRRFEIDGIENREQKTQSALEAGIIRDVRPTDTLTKIRLSPELSTFYDALVSTDVISEIDPSTMGTIFAPTNEAFASLPNGTLESLTEEQLKQTLRFHVAARGSLRTYRSPVGPYDIDTLANASFSVGFVDGEFKINEQVTLAEADIFSTRSTIQTLNDVLFPPLD